MIFELNFEILKLTTILLISVVYDPAAAFQENDATIRIVDRTAKTNVHSPGQQYFGDQITIDVITSDRTLTLELTANKHLIHPSYIEKTIDEFGRTQYQANANTTIKDCYYVGKLANDSYSSAAASTCSGLSAHIQSGDHFYHVVPMDNTLTGRHKIVRQSGSQLPVSTCGHVHGASLPSQFQRRKKRASLNWPQDLKGVTRVVELYIVNDFTQYVDKGRNIQNVTSRAKALVNLVSLLYQPLNVFVVLVGMETWTGRSLITINATNYRQTKQNFQSYRAKNITQRNDHGQLVLPFTFPGGVVGAADLGAMCSSNMSDAIVNDFRSNLAFAAQVSAHEMGHTFGMEHDDQVPGCICAVGTKKCIMVGVSIPPSTTWSQCSIATMKSFLASRRSYCLNDFNSVLFDPTPVCGNGVVEGNEQCDCGNAPRTECNSSCCNPLTCSLVSNAQCAAGLCCNITTCLMKPVTTVCRAAAGPCDLAEYCSGVKNTCPSDIYLHNGTNCTVAGETSYCYNGLCRTQTTQCGLWWGNTIKSAYDQCYSRFNVRGDDSGNCAAKRPSITGVNVPCAPSDIKCGLLMCEIVVTNVSRQGVFNFPGFPGNIQPYISSNTQPYFRGISFSITSGGTKRKFNCTSGYYDNGDPLLVDLGYVPDGAVCGSNMMCLNRRCVATSNVTNTVPCPFCNNKGVCNSLGQCHCDVGYAPPDCKNPGNGGSYHSNAIKIRK